VSYDDVAANPAIALWLQSTRLVAAVADFASLSVMAHDSSNVPKVRADFNGLFGELLCLSHSDTCADESGALIQLRTGMVVTAFDEDYEQGVRDDLIATGTVEPSPDWLRCNGSKWALRIDKDGVRHESDTTRH
jgi:hypothetical protein